MVFKLLIFHIVRFDSFTLTGWRRNLRISDLFGLTKRNRQIILEINN